MKSFLSGLILGLLALPLAACFYLKFGNPPVAVADKPFPFEKQIVHIPLHARIARQMPKSVPIQPTDENLLAGAQLYSENCAGCHGTYASTSTFGQHLYPWAPQLLQVHGPHRVVGVSDDPAGATYWKIANGIRLTGMPSFNQMLSPTQMWQISVLLANADKPMPKPVQDLLTKPIAF